MAHGCRGQQQTRRPPRRTCGRDKDAAPRCGPGRKGWGGRGEGPLALGKEIAARCAKTTPVLSKKIVLFKPTTFSAKSDFKALHLSRTILDTSGQTCGNFAPQAALTVSVEKMITLVLDIIVLMVLPRETNNNTMPLFSFHLYFMCVHRPFAFFCDASWCPPLISPPFLCPPKARTPSPWRKSRPLS